MKKVFKIIILVIVLTLLICISVSIYKLNVYTEEKVEKILSLGNAIKSNNYYYEINRYVDNDSGTSECIFNYKKYFLNNSIYEINTFTENEVENFEIIYDYPNKTEYVIGEKTINCNKNVDFSNSLFKEYFDYKMDLSKKDKLLSNAFQYDGKEMVDGNKCIKIEIFKTENGVYYRNDYYISEKEGLILKKDFYSGQSYDELSLNQTETYTHKYEIVKESDIKEFNIENYPDYDYYEVDISNINETETLFNNIDVNYDPETISNKSIKVIINDLNEPQSDSFEIDNVKVEKNYENSEKENKSTDEEKLNGKFKNEMVIDWYEQYGELENGRYTLTFDLVMNITDNTSLRKEYSVEFEIK